MFVRYPGWRTGANCTPLRHGTVARRANRNVGPCWIFWVWNQGAFVVLWLVCWDCWPPWRPKLAARLAQLLLGVTISAMGVWRVAQRLGQAAASYSEALSQYHADSRSEGASVEEAPPAVILGVDGCTLGMQIRPHRRRRVGTEPLPALPVIEQGHFREVKTGVLLLPSERVETSPGRRSVVRRYLVTCLGEADEIFRRLYAQLRELGWLDPDHTVVVIVGGPRGYPAEWIWNRAPMFVHHCEILDFWHALEHAWTFARLRFRRGFRTGRPLGSSSCRRPAGRQGARGDRRLETPAA